MNKTKRDWKNDNTAKICLLFNPFLAGMVKVIQAKGIVKGKISSIKKGKNGFGYDPIFIPEGYNKTFSEMRPKLKMSIDHSYMAYLKINEIY